MKYFRAIILLSLAQAAADARADAPTTDVNFVDECTNEVVALAPPGVGLFNSPDVRDVELVTEITGLIPHEKVWLRTELGPLGFVVNSNDTQTNEDTQRADGTGHLLVKHGVNLSRWKKLSGPVIVVAKVQWAQRGADPRSGGSSASMAIPRSQNTFRVLSQPLCNWESPVEIVSNYRFNTATNGNSELRIDRDESVSSFIARVYGFGVGLGNANQIGPAWSYLQGAGYYGGGPNARNALPSNSPVGLWFFDQWHVAYGSVEATTLRETWTLHPEDGGFFGRRYSFTRFEAEEYEREHHLGHCSRWKFVRKGFLDASVARETLYSVPPYLAGKPHEARAFMERLHPPLNTCGDRAIVGKIEDQVPSQPKAPEQVAESPMYFHPSN